MIVINCGTRIRNGSMAPGTAGALVSVASLPDRLFLLTAGHVAVPRNALNQPNPIYAESDPVSAIGELWTWSKLGIGITVDAALLWVDSARVDPTILGLGGAPLEINPNPAPGTKLTLYATKASQQTRTANVAQTGYSIDLEVAAWGGYASYFGQILTASMVSEPGDSGSLVFDDEGSVVGMLVGGAEGIGDIITPIDAILNHPQWKGQLQFVQKVDLASAKPPPGLIGTASVTTTTVASPGFGDLKTAVAAPQEPLLPPNPKIPMDVLLSARRSEVEYAVPTSVTLAQWALESGWGKSVSGKWNYGGITARVKGAVFPSVPGTPLEPATLCWTHENYQGQNVKCQRWFKDFASPDAFFEAHAKLLGTSPKYAAARAELPDVDAYVDTMGPVYATDKNYAATIKSIMRTNGLYAYNLPADGAHEA